MAVRIFSMKCGRVFMICLAVSFMLLASRFAMTGSVVGGDAVFYYMNVRSLAIDHDIDFLNEHEHYYNQFSSFTGNRKINAIPPANPVTGKVPIKFQIGGALMLLPFFYAGHVLTLLLQAAGFSVSADGYGPIYQLAAATGSLLYGAAGIYLIYLLGKKIFGHEIALAGSVVMWFATPLIYYMTMEPMMSHTLSMFTVTLFVFIWYATREKRTARQWALLGLSGGLMSIVRNQDALFLLIPFIDVFLAIVKRADLEAEPLRKHVYGTACFLITFFLVVSIQMYVNDVLYGSPFSNGYVDAGQGFPNWKTPKILYVLLSLHNGLLLWSPVVILCIAGMAYFIKKHLTAGSLMLLAFFLQVYLLGSFSSPELGHTFGNRVLLNSTVVLAVGLMALLHVFRKNERTFGYVINLCLCLIAANAILAALYCFRIIGSPY